MTHETEANIISLEELRYRMNDVFAITELVTKILETAACDLPDPDEPPDFGGNVDDAYNAGIGDGYTLFARQLVDLINEKLNMEGE